MAARARSLCWLFAASIPALPLTGMVQLARPEKTQLVVRRPFGAPERRCALPQEVFQAIFGQPLPSGAFDLSMERNCGGEPPRIEMLGAAQGVQPDTPGGQAEVCIVASSGLPVGLREAPSVSKQGLHGRPLLQVPAEALRAQAKAALRPLEWPSPLPRGLFQIRMRLRAGAEAIAAITSAARRVPEWDLGGWRPYPLCQVLRPTPVQPGSSVREPTGSPLVVIGPSDYYYRPDQGSGWHAVIVVDQLSGLVHIGAVRAGAYPVQ